MEPRGFPTATVRDSQLSFSLAAFTMEEASERSACLVCGSGILTNASRSWATSAARIASPLLAGASLGSSNLSKKYGTETPRIAAR